jgi:archaellum component FlaC
MEQVKETVAVHSAEIDHMKKDIDHILSTVEKLDQKVDNIEKVLSELSGGKKAMIWFIGAIAAIISFLFGHWMDK